MPLVVSEQYPRGLGPTVPGHRRRARGRGRGRQPVLRLEKTAFACTEEPAFAPLLEQLGGASGSGW